MKLGPLNISLAKPAPPVTGSEIGTSVNGLVPSIINEEFIDTSKIKVADLKKMLDNDGTVQALYNIMVMPLLGANWTIEPDEDTPEGKKQTEEVIEMLSMPPHKGGMSTPFDLVMSQMLRGVLEGYAGFEKVYRNPAEHPGGKLTFRKIAWRDPTTLTFLVDSRGGFNGLKQRTFIGANYGEVVIPKERCFLYTYGKEFHNLKGRSAFTAAYSSYDKKRRLYYLSEQQAQSDALKTKVVSVNGESKISDTDLKETVNAVDELGFKATVGLPKGYDIDTLNKQSAMDLMPLMEHHNAEMARSVLAMFILLGTGGKTGSYSLSQDQSDFFIQALMSIRKSVENHVTSYLIPDLYTYNYAKPVYGTFKLEDLTDSTIELLKQAFIKIIEKDRLSSDMVNGIVDRVADKLDIDVDKLSQEAPEEEEEPQQKPVDNSKKKSSLATGGWRRELTPAEQKVNFTGIERKLNTLEAEFEREIQPVYDMLAKGATEKLNGYLEAKDYEKVTLKNLFDENLRNQYTKVLKDQSMNAYTFGKNGAADELEIKAPATPKDSKTFISEQAKSISEKHFTDLTFLVKQEVQKALRKDQLSKKDIVVEFATGDVIAAVVIVFASFFTDKIGLTASASVAAALNRGRKDSFVEAAAEIYGYQYSAILDHRTCPICEDLDGSVVNEREYRNTTFDPPIHHRCRCIWVAILNDEQDPPEITGMPDTPGGATEPSLSKEYVNISSMESRA